MNEILAANTPPIIVHVTLDLSVRLSQLRGERNFLSVVVEELTFLSFTLSVISVLLSWRIVVPLSSTDFIMN